MFGAGTLGQAIKRSGAALHRHSTCDKLSVATRLALRLFILTVMRSGLPARP